MFENNGSNALKQYEYIENYEPIEIPQKPKPSQRRKRGSRQMPK